MNKIPSLIIIFISAFIIMCSEKEREIVYTYEGEFPRATQIDLGDPLFYKIDKYYVYDNNLSLEVNAKFDPILLKDHFIAVFEHDSLSGDIAKIEFQLNKPILEAIVFASGSNRFNNVRFSAGEPFLVKVKK
jgi:hypothetical protein